MKRTIYLAALLALFLFCPAIKAEAHETEADFSALFEEHGAVMMLIDPDTGDIIRANAAAADFYGYTKEQMESMKIDQINIYSKDEFDAEIAAAKEQDRSYFLYKEKLATGVIRTVEVYSYPVSFEGREVLFSIVHDVTENMLLEQKEQKTIVGIFIGSAIVIAILLILLNLLNRNRKSLIQSKNEIEALNQLRQTFFNAADSMMYIKDENLRYVFVNRAFANLFHKEPKELLGKDDFEISEPGIANKRRENDLEVLQKKALTSGKTDYDGKVYKSTKFPVRLPSGRIGVGAYVTDITLQQETEKKQEKTLNRHRILVDVLTRHFRNTNDQLDYVLHEALTMTGSQYGYIYLYDEEKREFILNSWTKGVMDACSVEIKPEIYKLENTGIWGEVVRQRSPIVVNDFEKPNPLKKGYPEGHVKLKRFMSVPVIIDDKIVAVIGVANKQGDYDESDVYELMLLMNGAWNAVERRQAQEKLSLERNKYLQILISIGDGVMVVDKDGRVEMLNRIAEGLTGWTASDAFLRHYSEVFVLTSEQQGVDINDPVAAALESGTIQTLENHVLLVSKDGKKYYVEDSAAPIKDENDQTVGIVLVFRDVSSQKEQRREIEYLSFHDYLTGLYNRRFFEEEFVRLDTQRSLPITIIMGDVNGLKLTNDIFGHSSGDMLLKTLAEVLKRVCRADDIIARWGGDEFVILLPNTETNEAEQVIARIKEEFSKEKVRAIKGSVSMGAYTRRSLSENIADSLNRAEEKMYLEKTVERDEVREKTIETIIKTIEENSPKEREHSQIVSELSGKMGRELGLPEIEVRKLKSAGYLHDIGKVTHDPGLFERNSNWSEEEWKEFKRHPIIGYRILNSFDDTLDLAEIILAHEEKWDGSGYPKGLRGEEIPYLARIISVVEGYTHLLSGTRLPEKEKRLKAIQAIREKAGTNFDPEIAEFFARMMESELNQ